MGIGHVSGEEQYERVRWKASMMRLIIVGCWLWCWFMGRMFLGFFLGRIMT